VLAIIKVQGDDLDQNYMRHWAATLGVLDLLDRAYDRAPTPPDEEEPQQGRLWD
jgi:hypothetical protein